MNVKQLSDTLQELHAILAATNAKGQARDVAAFMKLFEGAEEKEVSVFLDELKARLQLRAAPASEIALLPDQRVVAIYSQLLRNAGTDKPAFDAAFSQLKKDKAIDRAEAEAIAYEYIGFPDGRRSWPHRAAALQAIEDWFMDLAYDAVKSIQLDKARYVG